MVKPIVLLFGEKDKYKPLKVIEWIFRHCKSGRPFIEDRYTNDLAYIMEVTIDDEEVRLMFMMSWSEYIVTEEIQ